MAFKVIDRLFVVVYAANPTQDEWWNYLEVVTRHGVARTAQIIFTDGYGPSLTQRRELEKQLTGGRSRVAVITTSAVLRGVVTVYSWFNSNIRVFPDNGISDALVYLEVPARRAVLVEGEVAKLRVELRHVERVARVSMR